MTIARTAWAALLVWGLWGCVEEPADEPSSDDAAATDAAATIAESAMRTP